jgi:hypothetical protein
MNIEIYATLALTAKLQAAEARALAAEASLVQIDDAIHLSLQAKDSWTGLKAVTCAISQMRQLDLTAAREMMRKAGEAETIRTERDELAALVETVRDGLIQAVGRMTVWNEDIKAKVMPIEDDEAIAEIEELLKLSRTPPAALAALRQKIRVEVLEEVAVRITSDFLFYWPQHREIIADKIRAMKEAQ